VYGKIRRIHLVGIGGSGMNGIAEVLLNKGYTVTGSDLALGEVTRRLEGLGATVHEGHDAANVRGADVVVVSTAVGADNPEVLEARRLNVPVIPRAEMLAELMRMSYGIAVSGAHGKTTTTSLIGAVLTKGGFDPTVVVGGRVRAFGSHVILGHGKFMVAEADESDGSFLNLVPTISVITNIDVEHLDYYKGGLEEIKSSFVRFANKVPFFGAAIVCLDDPNIASIVHRIDRRTLTYAVRRKAKVTASEVRAAGMATEFTVHTNGDKLGTVELPMPGLHNVYNALAAVCVGLEVGIPFGSISDALCEFEGVSRRFEIVGETGGIVVLDDYGHHPTEIEAVLKAAKSVWPDRRLVVVFQPHRYTRTQALCHTFGSCFDEADLVLLTDIYAAGEKKMVGVSSHLILEAARERGHGAAYYVGDLASARDSLMRQAKPGDIVITLGAGDVWKVGVEFLERSRENVNSSGGARL
jgi:UDP-N-acetylmuramate--alanine ligase